MLCCWENDGSSFQKVLEKRDYLDTCQSGFKIGHGIKTMQPPNPPNKSFSSFPHISVEVENFYYRFCIPAWSWIESTEIDQDDN